MTCYKDVLHDVLRRGDVLRWCYKGRVTCDGRVTQTYYTDVLHLTDVLHVTYYTSVLQGRIKRRVTRGQRVTVSFNRARGN